MNHIQSLFIIILIVIFDICATICIKKSKENEFIKYISIVIVFYLGIIALLYILDYTLLPGNHLNILRSMLSLCFAILLGDLFYITRFNKYNIISMIFAIFAIIFSYLSLS
jgi:hypothetical protein